MRGTIRLGIAVAAVCLTSLLLVPWQWLALQTGWLDPAVPARLWHQAVLRAMGWRLRVEGGIAPARPLLVVANHVSWSDIVVLGSQAELVFVSKVEVGNWPVFGWLARLQHTIFIERERRAKAGKQAGAMAGHLRRGAAVALFPEGTTADGNQLLPFKSALFGALDWGAPPCGEALPPVAVQPAAIAYTHCYGVPMGRWERSVASWMGERSLGFHLRLLFRHGPLDVVLRWGEPVVCSHPIARKKIAADSENAVAAMMTDALRGEPAGLSKPAETR